MTTPAPTDDDSAGTAAATSSRFSAERPDEAPGDRLASSERRSVREGSTVIEQEAVDANDAPGAEAVRSDGPAAAAGAPLHDVLAGDPLDMPDGLPADGHAADAASTASGDGQAATVGQPTLVDRLVDLLVQRSRLALAVTLLVVAISAPIALRTEMDTSIEPMFRPDDPALVALKESRAIFGGDEFVLVAYDVRGEEELLDREHLDALKAFAERLSAIAGVRASSTQDLGHLLRPDESNSFGMGLYLRLPSVREKILEFSEGLLVSPNRQTTAVVLRLEPGTREVPRAETIAEIRTMAAGHEPPAVVVGEPVLIQDTFNFVQRDGRLLGVASSVLLMLVIAGLFRRVRWVVMPLLVVWAALSLTRATMFALDLRISMVSSVLTSLVTIIGIATTMHVTVHYREKRVEGLSRETALRETMRAVGPAVFWSCVTTALGFLALASSRVVPVRDFGLMMALGVLFVLMLALVLLPCGILLGRRPSDPKQSLLDGVLAMGLRRLVRHLSRHGGKWVAASVATLLLGGWGLTRLTIETDYTKNFRAGSPIVRALDFFEQRMGGAGSWELLLPAPEASSLGLSDRLRALRDRLRAIEVSDEAGRSVALTKVITLADGVDMIPPIMRRRARRGGDSELDLLAGFQPEFAPSLFQPGDGTMRVMLRASERQPSELKLKLVEEVTAVARDFAPEAQPTGMFILLANLVGSLLRDQWASFLLAAGGIWLAISLAFRSPLMGLVALVPNMLPIAIVIGTIGWMDVPVNMGTAMIASVSMGLTVDSAIHYIAAYRRHRREGRRIWDALSLVHADTGRALIFSHAALVGGFSVLALSSFVPLIYFGLLVSAAMFVGLFGVLVMLPVLLAWTDREPAVAEARAASREEPAPQASVA